MRPMYQGPVAGRTRGRAGSGEVLHRRGVLGVRFSAVPGLPRGLLLAPGRVTNHGAWIRHPLNTRTTHHPRRPRERARVTNEGLSRLGACAIRPPTQVPVWLIGNETPGRLRLPRDEAPAHRRTCPALYSLVRQIAPARRRSDRSCLRAVLKTVRPRIDRSAGLPR
jgi:hypothetical protein